MGRERCLEAGCDDYVTKPVERGAFVAMCRRWLENGSPRAPLPASPRSDAQSGSLFSGQPKPEQASGREIRG